MLIKSVRLSNIRSYESHEVKFPVGSVLLAGDIGTGKSTILLAIEFAIFGAKKSELPAYALLRHGKKEGSVEMLINIDNKEVIVKRTLKRGKDDIRQEAGYVIVNGMKKEGTAEELRAILLDLLGYPKDLISKSKDLIYRYTVYTPQDEMKQILNEKKETRLDTLRKVFAVDKYKRISDNSRIITALLREKKRHLEGFVLGMEYKLKEIDERKKEALQLESSVRDVMPKIDDIKNIISQKKSLLAGIENGINELNALKKELSIAETSMMHRIEQNNRLNDEIKKLEAQAEELKKQISLTSPEQAKTIKERIAEKERQIRDLDAQHKDLIRKIRELEVRKEHSSETIRKITSLDICPVCEQKVDEHHKHSVNAREGKKSEEADISIREALKEESGIKEMKESAKKELEALAQEQNRLVILKIKTENLNEKAALKESKISLKENVKKEIGILNAKKAQLAKKISEYSGVEEKYGNLKKEIDGLLPQERFLELEKRKYETELASVKRFIAGLEKEISEKQKAKEDLVHISQLGSWISDFFVNLMSTIEKHVMASVHSQFNEFFRRWFGILMEDETINVRLDEDFTPVIEQNGYETFIENLSGGEKTSVALSYRLALNKVINDLVAGIKTKDIIMLDEPTDGFSSEQLDKMREVLEQLNMKQVIIVSHESKIESFVDNVIRVQKQEHMSTTA